jgi:hypothetical protein
MTKTYFYYAINVKSPHWWYHRDVGKWYHSEDENRPTNGCQNWQHERRIKNVRNTYYDLSQRLPPEVKFTITKTWVPARRLKGNKNVPIWEQTFTY